MTDYLKWQSNLSAEAVFEGAPSLAYPHIFDEGYVYLGADKADKGRSVIVYQGVNQSKILTPPPYAIRSGVSEYGGKAFWINQSDLFFVNQADQCLYRQDLTAAINSSSPATPQRVSPLPNDRARFMYTDLNFISQDLALAVIERESQQQEHRVENESFIGMLDFRAAESPPRKLVDGADFHSNLCVDRTNNKAAWVQWNHPNMPWDNTQLMLADLDPTEFDTGEIALANIAKVDLGGLSSVCQLIFAKNGTLFFSADFAGQDEESPANFWNIYAIPDTRSKEIVPVSESLKEFGYPHWQYGNARIVQLDETQLLTVASSTQGDELFLIDQQSMKISSIGETNCGFENLSSDQSGRAMCLMLSEKKLPQIASFTSKSKEFTAVAPALSLMDEEEISLSQHFEFQCSDGDKAYGYYYPPVNSAYMDSTTDNNKPPLLVMVHGGPTARAYGYFDIQKQFWTQRGFAIFDVNHRGSSGYGRKYRDALYGHWGEIDCQDIVDGISHLVANGKADRDRVCIRGKSAGGYAVLRALTEHPQVFRAGACYYGIGNLLTLAETTHKFEKYYTDRLIDEPYNSETATKHTSKFYQRSPINKLNQLASAMIVFQGGQDKVVPPSVAHEVIATLKALNLDHSYVEYAEEGHGFRQSKNNIDAWTKELDFYLTSLRAV